MQYEINLLQVLSLFKTFLTPVILCSANVCYVPIPVGNKMGAHLVNIAWFLYILI